MSSPATPRERPPVRRHRSGRLVAGVAGGVAEHLGVPVGRVRLGFALLGALGGAGFLAYLLCWIFIPQERGDVERVVPPGERRQALGLAALGLGVAVAASAAGDTVVGWVAGPLGLVALGIGLIWREADDTRRRRWVPTGLRGGVLGRGGRAAVLRVLTGTLLVAGGLGVFLLGRLDLDQLRSGLLAVLATLVGVAVLTVPFWVRLSRDLREERSERIRAAERAELAAHLHDSVLQTLALIQRQSGAPREVLRLARGQERELRTWLYGPAGYGRAGAAAGAPPGSPGGVRTGEPAGTLAEAVAAVAAEVEDTYAVAVRPVVVGDCPLTDRLPVLVAAGREAMVNAAKHAGVAEVSLYLEVEPETVHLFVRDRGVGFDPAEVPADRHGLAHSVHGRMDRHGGSAALRSTPGEGTEVHLEMPRDPEPRVGPSGGPVAPADGGAAGEGSATAAVAPARGTGTGRTG